MELDADAEHVRLQGRKGDADGEGGEGGPGRALNAEEERLDGQVRDGAQADEEREDKVPQQRHVRAVRDQQQEPHRREREHVEEAVQVREVDDVVLEPIPNPSSSSSASAPASASASAASSTAATAPAAIVDQARLEGDAEEQRREVQRRHHREQPAMPQEISARLHVMRVHWVGAAELGGIPRVDSAQSSAGFSAFSSWIRSEIR